MVLVIAADRHSPPPVPKGLIGPDGQRYFSGEEVTRLPDSAAPVGAETCVHSLPVPRDFAPMLERELERHGLVILSDAADHVGRRLALEEALGSFLAELRRE